MKKIRSFFITCLILAVGVFIVYQGLDFLFGQNKPFKSDQAEPMNDSLYLVAVGDSLTEGVGDSTQNGGYVPLTANLLRETNSIKEVTTKNYGKSGDRSDQILSRIQQQEEIQSDLKKADIIVLTVGGNDVIQTFKKDTLNINQDSFIQPKKKYETELKTILSEFNKLNPKAQVYVFGIYNPYADLFPDITEMQTILDSWNQSTKELVEKEEGVYLSLDDIFNLSKLPLSEDGVADSSLAAEQAEINPLLYEEDLFHPNDKGYELMAEKLYQAILKQRIAEE